MATFTGQAKRIEDGTYAGVILKDGQPVMEVESPDRARVAAEIAQRTEDWARDNGLPHDGDAFLAGLAADYEQAWHERDHP